MMSKDLRVLDELEELRQKTLDRPDRFTTECTLRIASDIVAVSYGYKSRSEWINALKRNPDSTCSYRIQNNNYHS